MTVDQFIQEQERKLEHLIKFNDPLRIAALDTTIVMAERIFIKGENSSGGNIGQYSKEPFYVDPNGVGTTRKTSKNSKGIQGLLPRLGNPEASLIDDADKGKGEQYFNKRTYYRGGKGAYPGSEHKTTYLKGGMKELRNRVGLRIDKVNLTFTGEFVSDFCNSGAMSTGKPVNIKKTPSNTKPTKVNKDRYDIALKRTGNVKKAEYWTEKYGQIFQLQEKEKKHFLETIQFELDKVFT